MTELFIRSLKLKRHFATFFSSKYGKIPRVSGQHRSGRRRRRDMQLLVKCINLIIEKEKRTAISPPHLSREPNNMKSMKET